MERVEKYRELVKQVLEEYASYKFSSGEIEVMSVFDLERDHYQVVSAGWKNERRIYGCSVDIDIKDSKIWGMSIIRTENRVKHCYMNNTKFFQC
jgi:XisI protein